MKPINQEQFVGGYKYSMESSCGFGNVEILVDAEIGGHGCLFGVKLPPMSIKGGYWEGDRQFPEKTEVLHVLNKIFEDFNCNERIVKGLKPV